MKPNVVIFLALLTMLALRLPAQGTFIYDQQSADENSVAVGLSKLIQTQEPIGQSFVPALSSIGFVSLYMEDQNANNGKGATLLLEVLAGSINGTVVGTSEPLSLPDNDGIAGPAYPTFIFSTPVGVNPGTPYYFDVVVQSGDPWLMKGSDAYNYENGASFLAGAANPDPNFDFWFREGIVVPEPSTWAMLLLGGGALALRRRTCLAIASHATAEVR